jgi:hypothetical protein
MGYILTWIANKIKKPKNRRETVPRQERENKNAVFRRFLMMGNGAVRIGFGVKNF